MKYFWLFVSIKYFVSLLRDVKDKFVIAIHHNMCIKKHKPRYLQFFAWPVKVRYGGFTTLENTNGFETCTQVGRTGGIFVTSKLVR